MSAVVAICSVPYVLASSEDPTSVGELQNHPVYREPVIPWQLKEIARCESHSRHYNDSGEVIRGKVNPLDIGTYQINLKYHQAEAESMGLDLFDEEDNETYALYLYKTQGAQPWSASNSCHHLLG